MRDEMEMVSGAHMLPEVDGARIIVKKEGGELPPWGWNVVCRSHLPSGNLPLLGSKDGWPYDVMLVKPMSREQMLEATTLVSSAESWWRDRLLNGKSRWQRWREIKSWWYFHND